MAREIPWLSRDEFWSAIEGCRQASTDTTTFAERLLVELSAWEFKRLGAFHNTMWYDVGVFHRGALWDLVYQQEPLLGSQNAWECYGGWLIAQGRAFHEAVMNHPSLALARLPSWEEIDIGETIIFAAQEACIRKTERRYDLYDMLGDFLPADAFKDSRYHSRSQTEFGNERTQGCTWWRHDRRKAKVLAPIDTG